MKLATKSIGPIGECWGYSIKEERIDNTRPMMILSLDGKGREMLRDGENIVWEQNHTILIEFWHGARENTFLQYGHTKYRYMKNDGSKIIVDNEYAKKSLTDAMKKCLSLIGICSDVFMGEFDDVNYQAAAKLENDLKKADNRDEEYSKKLSEFKAFVDDKAKAMGMCPSFDSMQRVYGLAVQKIDREAPILNLDAAIEKKGVDAKYYEMKEKFDKDESNEAV